MIIRLLVSLFFIVLIPSAAIAQPVTDAQTICFFFDEAATIRSHYGTGVIVGYIVVNPLWVGGQWAEDLNRWTCTFYWQAEAGVVGNCNIWPSQGWPVDIPAVSGSADVDVNCDLPLNPEGPTVVSMVGFHVALAEHVSIFIAPGEFWADGGQNGLFLHLTSGPSPMDITEHVANINAPAPTADEQRTWGGIKLLYR